MPRPIPALLVTAMVAAALIAPATAGAASPAPVRAASFSVPAAVPSYVSYPGVSVINSIPSAKGKIFLTVDDGNVKLSSTLKILAGTPSTIFPIGGEVAKAPSYFRALARAGRVIENHTASHARLTSQSLADQTNAICRANAQVVKAIGVAPKLLRPPYGSFNVSTLKAAKACGITKVILWDVTVGNGKIATWGGPLKSGDIILMHFTPTFARDFALIKARVASAHLTFANLTDYIH